MSVWDEYLAAAEDLDDVRRESDATVAAQRAAAEDAATTLTGVRQRIALQRSRLAEVASGVTRNAPTVEPLPAERAEAVAAFAPHGALEALGAATGPDIDAALRTSWATLDAADATLTAATSVPRRAGPLADRPPGVRAIVVYGWFALLSLVALIEINSIANGASFVILACAVAVPVAGWLLGWLCLRLLSDNITAGAPGVVASGPGATSGARRPSGALLGALLCAVPAIVGVVLATV